MINLYKIAKQYLLYERDAISNVSSTIDKRNRNALKLVLLIIFTCFCAIFAISLFSNYFLLANPSYIRLLSITGALIIYIFYLKLAYYPNFYSLWMVYFVYALPVFFCVLSNDFIFKHNIHILILVFLFQFPILFLDKSLRMDFFFYCCLSIYIICFYRLHPFTESVEYTIYVFGASLGAILLGHRHRHTRLEALTARAELKSYAYMDPLTKLLNRRKLMLDLEQSSSLKGANIITGIAIIDIDFFKRYNDKYGHQTGDRCLTEISKLFLLYQEKTGITFYRYGGEEFIVTFCNFTDNRILKMLNNIRVDVSNLKVKANNIETPLAPTVSIGFSSFKMNEWFDYSTLIARADKALYKAKELGRNQVVMYEE